MECVDLKEWFGKKYRVTYEESYRAQHGPKAWGNDPWLQIMPCQRGHIFPWGESTLAASTNSRGPTATKLAALDFATVHQDGDDGVTVAFPVDQFNIVAALMQPRRRRHMTEEQKAVAVERLASFAFTPARQSSLESAVCVGRA